MKRSEFEKIFNSAHEKAMTEMVEKMKPAFEGDSFNISQLLAYIAAGAVEAAENSVINTLVQAGFISFDD